MKSNSTTQRELIENRRLIIFNDVMTLIAIIFSLMCCLITSKSIYINQKTNMIYTLRHYFSALIHRVRLDAKMHIILIVYA
jgi:hypothetical protein